MSLYTNPSIPTKVLHMHFILPSFLLSICSFQFIFCVISRDFKYIYIYIVGRKWKEDTEDFYFLYTDVPFESIVWVQAGNIQKPPISLAYTQDSRNIMADVDKLF